MSIFSSIQLANNALQAAQIGLQVTGNNIANANTPGYIRQQALFEATPPQRVGNLLLGTGVNVAAIKQQTDHFLEERLRGATSDLANGETQESTYLELESLIGELGETDLSTSLTRFFGSLSDVLNQPESVSVRNMAVLQGKKLTDDVRELDRRVNVLSQNLNQRVIGQADSINALLDDLARLNVQIITAEGGDTTSSDAVGLRDRRLLALAQLSKIIDTKAVEQSNGSLTVFSGGEFLVFDGITRPVKAVLIAGGDFNRAEIRVAETDSLVQSASGELNGLIISRDGILGGFRSRLNELVRTLAFEFNKLHSGGQGLTGFAELTSESGVDDAFAALDEAGLPFTPVNGSFQVQVRNTQTGITQTTDVLVDLNGFDQDTTLDSLAAALDAIGGISATITLDRKLRITRDASNVEFAFAQDTSGVLAALGMNTFFSGDSAANLGISAVVRADPSKLAASSGGIANDSRSAELLASFFDRPLDSQSGDSLTDMYDRLTSETAQAAATSRSVAEGFRIFQKTLEGQHLGISGVSLDEEAVRMIIFQRSFQASARYISALGELLDTLVNL